MSAWGLVRLDFNILQNTWAMGIQAHNNTLWFQEAWEVSNWIHENKSTPCLFQLNKVKSAGFDPPWYTFLAATGHQWRFGDRGHGSATSHSIRVRWFRHPHLTLLYGSANRQDTQHGDMKCARYTMIATKQHISHQRLCAFREDQGNMTKI